MRRTHPRARTAAAPPRRAPRLPPASELATWRECVYFGVPKMGAWLPDDRRHALKYITVGMTVMIF
eukprot:scaffold5853_cov112-Isochrysis_galbana.AAC.2